MRALAAAFQIKVSPTDLLLVVPLLCAVVASAIVPTGTEDAINRLRLTDFAFLVMPLRLSKQRVQRLGVWRRKLEDRLDGHSRLLDRSLLYAIRADQVVGNVPNTVRLVQQLSRPLMVRLLPLLVDQVAA